MGASIFPWLRRAVFVLAMALLPLPALGSPAPDFSLSPGEAVFWSGPHVETSDGGRCGGSPCWSYRIRLESTGYRFRVGIDHPEIGDRFDVELFDPDGGRVAAFSPGTGLYSSEHLEEEPQPGVWRVLVIARDVTDSDFRMRAKLEARPPGLGTRSGPVLPNLQILPPHETSFLMPVTNGGFGDPPQGADLEGAESCHPEEHAEDRALRCLRFAFGIRNTGLGPLSLHLGGGMAFQEVELIQRIYRADDTYYDRSAGVARYHKTHGHYHHDAAVALRLYRVTDVERGALEVAGEKRMKGFAHREELIRDWEHFYPTWSADGFGLRAGWADIYEWDRPGNYIDFGLNPDGRYVIRMWADPVDGIRESNERDNLGYSYVKISGDRVRLLEVGRGSDPWDPCKIVMGAGGHPDPPQGPRPKDCAPDTT